MRVFVRVSPCISKQRQRASEKGLALCTDAVTQVYSVKYTIDKLRTDIQNSSDKECKRNRCRSV